MCGIAGAISPDPSVREAAVVRRMLSAIAHRGPDDEGIDGGGHGTIGARRLSIIDLAGGHQPMTNEDGTILAVQNGELYNFEALRDELASLGHHFRTRNDTEILPHAYEEWGAGLVPRLRGMFAIAIWDSRRGTLLLARDRFGKKPLCYAQVGDGMVFASEIQGLLAHPGVAREVDDEAIGEYLTYGYISAPRTAFAAIRKVPPAHTLLFGVGTEPTVDRYWRLAFGPKVRMAPEEIDAELRRRIGEAVKLRLISDVPLGAFLSGGLDSSTVVAFMAMHSTTPVRTFSIGFADRRFDESAYARLVARTFGTDHHELIVDASDADILPTMVRHLGEPFADSSIVPTYHVARITRGQVTVALNGDGGDELFGGYDRYRAAMLGALVDRTLPRAVMRGAAAVLARIPTAPRVPHMARRLARVAGAIALAPEERHLRWTGYFTGSQRQGILGERLRDWPEPPHKAIAEAVALSGASHPAEQYMAADINTYLPGDLLVKMDIAAMANSLEGRSPLLDHDLAEFVTSLPAGQKVSYSTSKVLLRRAMRGILPPEILDRGKMGFSAPVATWLRGPLRVLFCEAVLDEACSIRRGYVQADGARALFAEHDSGRADRSPQLWALLMLELWLRECVDAPVSFMTSTGATANVTRS